MSDLDNGFHPKRTHGRDCIVTGNTTRPHHRNGGPAYMPSDEFMLGFEAGREAPESVIGFVFAAGCGFAGGLAVAAALVRVFA